MQFSKVLEVPEVFVGVSMYGCVCVACIHVHMRVCMSVRCIYVYVCIYIWFIVYLCVCVYMYDTVICDIFTCVHKLMCMVFLVGQRKCWVPDL